MNGTKKLLRPNTNWEKCRNSESKFGLKKEYQGRMFVSVLPLAYVWKVTNRPITIIPTRRMRIQGHIIIGAITKDWNRLIRVVRPQSLPLPFPLGCRCYAPHSPGCRIGEALSCIGLQLGGPLRKTGGPLLKTGGPLLKTGGPLLKTGAGP